MTPEGLYKYTLTKHYKDDIKEKTYYDKSDHDRDDNEENQSHMSNMVTTLKENLEGFTHRQIKQAKTTRKIYHNISMPIVTNFILAIAATFLGYLVLISYRKMKSRLHKIKM